MTPHPLVLDLLRIRQDMGLSQREAAERGGTTCLTISNWERGKCWPSVRELAPYAQSLGYRLTLTPERTTGEPSDPTPASTIAELTKDELEELAQTYATTTSPQLAVAVREQDADRIAELIEHLGVPELRTLAVVLAELVLAALTERTPLTPGQAHAREQQTLTRAADAVRRRVTEHARDDSDQAELLDVLGIDTEAQRGVA